MGVCHIQGPSKGPYSLTSTESHLSKFVTGYTTITPVLISGSEDHDLTLVFITHEYEDYIYFRENYLEM
jgi:hypothetical protein